MDGKSMRLRRTNRPASRGAARRKSALLEEERRQQAFEALTHTLLTCGTLWGAFWFQFVIGFMYNSPALHTLLRGNWADPYVGFYLPVHGPVAKSLAEIFAWLSVTGALLAIGGVWHWTQGVRGRWRMRILATGFAGFLALWSLAALAAKDAAWQAHEDRRNHSAIELVEPTH